MKYAIAAVALSAATLFAGQPASAEVTSRTVYSDQAWTVRVVDYGNKRLRCVAQVSRSGDIFSIWASPTSNVRLQFYSREWAFGNSHRGTLKVRIDRNPSWRMRNAELYKHSVLFNLPSSSQGSKFLLEVSRGDALNLYNDNGNHVRTYTLAGSRSSMAALIKCVRALRGGAGGSNPFD